MMLFPALTLPILTKNLRPRTLAFLPEIRLPEGVLPATSQPIIISAGYSCSRRSDANGQNVGEVACAFPVGSGA